MNEQRFHAAAALCAAVDHVRVLKYCEQVTGRPFVNETDLNLLHDAQTRWTFAKLGIYELSPVDVTQLTAELRRARRKL